MRSSFFVVLVMLLAPGATAATAQPAGRPIATRQSRFPIPFHVDRSARQVPPSEVRLYVREASAGTWRLAARARPEQVRFDFAAPHDGTFDFSIRNVDERGLEYPSGPHVAELTVLVDTREPTLQVTASSDAPGEVTVVWRAGDVNLDPTSLTIEYRTDARSAWRKVALDPAGRREGRATWRTTQQQRAIELQVQVSDLAGNLAVWSGRVSPSVAADRLAARATARLGPFRPGSVSQSTPATDTARPFSPDRNFATNRQRGDGSVAWSQAGRNGDAMQPSTTTANRPNRWAPPQRPPAGDAAGWRGAGGPQRSDRVAVTTLNDPSVVDPSTVDPRGRHGAFGVVTPANTGRHAPQIPGQQPGLPVIASPGAAVRAANAGRLEIDYDDQRIARSGARAVQIWSTRDDGRSWRLLDTDRDIRSPAVVDVEGEGTFGFRIVALGARDALGRPPQPGERPEMTLTVDLTRPSARITSARQTSPETLAIAWEASDARLAERPISLSYSVTPSGRRTNIAQRIANTGHYQWRLDARVPAQLYLHVEAKDAAGNIRHATFGRPVSLTLRQQPSGAVRDVRPLGTSANGPRRYQFY